MVMITLNDEAAVRATELARSRGVSTDEVVAELVLATPVPTETAKRRLALAGIGATEHGITSRIDTDLADGFGQDHHDD